MKKFKRVLPLLLIFIMLFSTMNVLATEDNIIKESSITQLESLYPINADSKEWATFQSTEEMFEATQVPIDKIKNMNTKNLLELALMHPLSVSILAYDNIDDGVNFLAENSNVFKELINKDDLSHSIVSKLKNNSLQKDIINTYTTNQKENQIIEEMIMVSLLSSTYINETDMNILKELKANKNITPYASIAYITTPRGSKVEVIIRGEELSSSEISSINSKYDKAYPNATRLRSATTNYNCHSYAWYSTSSSNKYWMNNPSKYWTDGSYSSTNSPQAGNKTFYYNGNHSAIITRRYEGPDRYGDYRDLLQLTSKWGTAGLYSHRGNYSPYSNGLKHYK